MKMRNVVASVRRVRLNIRTKLLLLALLLAWPPLIALSWLSLSSLERARETAVDSAGGALQSQAEYTLAERAADKAELYNSILTTVQQQVQGVAAYAETLAASAPPSAEGGRVWIVPGGPSPANERANAAAVARARQFIPLLRSVATQNPHISLGYIGLEQGGVVAFDHDVIDQLDGSFDPRQRGWYTAARDARKTVWVDTYIDANTKKLVTTCATPIYGPGGEFMGVVGFDILLETIQQDILKLDMGDNGYAFLMNGQGEMLVQPSMDVGGLDWNQPFVGENLLHAEDGSVRLVAQRMADRDQNVARLMFEGSDVYLAYAPITSAGWSVGIVVPVAEVRSAAEQIDAQINQRQSQLHTQVLLLIAFSIGCVGLLGVVMSSRISQPLRQLQAGAQRVAEGDLDHQIVIRSNDEIGDLGASFNTMTLALQQKMDELEDNLRQLATLNQISNDFKAMLSLRELLQAVPAAVCESLGFDRAVLYVLQSEHLWAVSASFGPGGEQLAEAFIKAANIEPIGLASQTVEADIIRSGQAVIVDNPWTHPRVLQSKQRASGSDTYVQVPIFGRHERVIGLLSADYHYSRKPITARDAAQLLTYASVVGLSIENTQLYNDLERQVTQRTGELRIALERAREADQLKSKFLTAISHELRTPLNAIIGFSTVMLDELDGPISAMQREDLKTINHNGRFLLHLINELLDLARIEANKIELNMETFDMCVLVREVTETVQGLIHNRPLTIRMALPDRPLLAHADRGKARQVLLNLLSNAVKFTEEGEIVIAARPVAMVADAASSGDAEHAEGRRTGTFVALSVRDTGIGIAPKNLPLLFEEFRQVHEGRTGTRGSGLGLAIARKLIELHGGRIWVESTLGQGSTFTFTLPLGQPAKPQLAPDSATEAALAV